MLITSIYVSILGMAASRSDRLLDALDDLGCVSHQALSLSLSFTHTHTHAHA
jgi:hypothetical protein